MAIQKLIFIIIWSFLSTGATIYFIKFFAFYKRKKEKEYNLSEAIYIASIISSAFFIFKLCLQNIQLSYDIIEKLFPSKLWINILQTSSAISITGFIFLFLFLLIARFLLSILYSERINLVEFSNDNRPYSLIRSSILILITLLLQPTLSATIGYFVPNDIPFFRQ